MCPPSTATVVIATTSGQLRRREECERHAALPEREHPSVDRRRQIVELIESLLHVDEPPVVSPEEEEMATHHGAGVAGLSPRATRCSPD
jgi:hypothetical protein